MNNARHALGNSLQVLEQAVEQRDHSHGLDLVSLVTGDLEALLAELKGHVEGGQSLARTALEVGRFKVLRLSVHQTYDESKGAVDMVIQDASVFHQRLEDELEEVPHPLACTLLVVHELAQAG